jgi:hypothetical protein
MAATMSREPHCYFCGAPEECKVPEQTYPLDAEIPSCEPCRDRALRHREALAIRACEVRR